MYVLVAEDDEPLARALGKILEENQYDVDLVSNGKDALDYAKSEPYDVVILDVMMPQMSGLEVVAQLRRCKISTPVLLLTARDAISDKITGYDSGADDYMTKPFSPAELLAHLRMLTRRKGEVVFEEDIAGDLTLNLESYDLMCGDKSIHLSYKEFCLMKVFMSNVGQVISKEMILNKVWGIDSTAEDNNVEAYISFIRKKLKFIDSCMKIETIRKAGYRLIESPKGE